MKKFLILMSILALSIPAYAASFPDVDESDTYYDAIEFLFAEGIVSGNDDSTYAPDRVLNRAELMKVIAEGASTYFGWAEGTFDLYINSTCFDDVPAGEWYTKYICYGKEMGWVVGYEDGTLFKPTQDVTFTEGLKITYMGFGLDYSEGEVWYQNVVEDASMYNYIPYTITAFDAGLARDAMADLVTRIIKYDTDELETYLGDRADIVVTYDTIEAGEDLSELVEEVVVVEEEETLTEGDTCTTEDGDGDAGFVFYSVFYEANMCFAIGETIMDTACTVSSDGGCESLEAYPDPMSYAISIESMAFVDGSMDVIVGDTITWNNDDTMAHTVDIESSESSGTIASGDSFSHTFNDPGTYTYFCALHPLMMGVITVMEP